ncbi:MAG: hypothetical protein SF123_08825 [Chloroflexota bacterium]|nr:hypothetical protein [Chloroflexota bacterium]
MRLRLFALLLVLFTLAGCGNAGQIIGGAVPTTGDTAADPSSAQRFLPNIAGFTATEATNITSAIAAVGGNTSLLLGDPVTSALITQIDRMIQCYSSVGAVAARVYTENNITGIIQGQIPRIGALAVINQDRIANNFLQCALGGGEGLGAQSIQPCAGSGTFTADGETLHYLYAATAPELCTVFVQAMPAQ